MCPTAKDLNSLTAEGEGRPGLEPRPLEVATFPSGGNGVAANTVTADGVSGTDLETYQFSKCSVGLWKKDGGKWITDKLSKILYIDPKDIMIAE